MVFLEVQTIRRRTEADVDVDRGLEELTRERMVECDEDGGCTLTPRGSEAMMSQT